MEHGQAVLGLFGPADEQVPKAVEPRMGTLHDPAAGLLVRLFGLGFLTPGPNVGRVAQGGQRVTYLFRVIARVQAPALLVPTRPVGLPGGFSDGANRASVLSSSRAEQRCDMLGQIVSYSPWRFSREELLPRAKLSLRSMSSAYCSNESTSD